MPAKSKSILKPKPKGKARPQEPQSENEFLEAADDFEQAAGKWRAGDAAKAARFFNRAIATYDEGLKRFPRSFDLAYNKANLEYSITEDERMVAQMGSQVVLLEETLGSHRLAASLDADNIDIQFNTAQVLTSLAETLLESGGQISAKNETKALLEEAVTLFTQCLKKQQHEYAQTQTEIAKAQPSAENHEEWQGESQRQLQGSSNADEMVDMSSSSEAGDWATIEEPLTPESILETCTAQLNAIVVLLGLYTPQHDLSDMEKMAQEGIETTSSRIPTLIELADRTPPTEAKAETQLGPVLSIGSTIAFEKVATSSKLDAILAVANFQASVAEMKYRIGRSTLTDYAQRIEQIFQALYQAFPRSNTPDLASINVQSAHADSLIDLASSLADSTSHTSSWSDPLAITEVQWTALSQAHTILNSMSLTPFSSVLSWSRLVNLFLALGDIDLFRFRIASMQSAKPAWINSKPVLLRNAGVYYRGARSYAEKLASAELCNVADAKALVVEIITDTTDGWTVVKESCKGKGTEISKVLEQMMEEGVIDRIIAAKVLQCTT